MTANSHRVHDHAIESLLPEIEWLSSQGDATPHHCSIIDEFDLAQAVRKRFAQPVKEDA
jgi:hypothetical protein